MSMKEVEVLRAACCVAGLDQQISVEEMKLLKALAERIGVGEMSLNAMIARATSDPGFFQEMFGILRHDPEETMKILFTVAMSDGKMLTEERIVMQHFSDLLKLPQARFDELLANAEAYCRKRAGEK